MDSVVDIAAIKSRLDEKLKAAGISLRAASNNANLGNGYVQHLLTSDADPLVTKLERVCRANGISFSYVLLGVEMSSETERLLRLIDEHPEKLESLLVLLGE